MSKARELAQKPNQPTGRKNLIINGDMQVAQRGLSGGATSAYTYTLDRWLANGNITSWSQTGTQKNVMQVVTQAGTGVAQRIESYGANFVSGNTYTLSFEVNPSVADVEIGVTFRNGNSFLSDVVSASDVSSQVTAGSYSKVTYTFTLSADADTSTYASHNMQVYIGSSVVNTLNIKNVQVEAGSVATEFEHRSFGEELALCQRYYYEVDSKGTGGSYPAFMAFRYKSATNTYTNVLNHPIYMRTGPTVTFQTGMRVHLPGLVVEAGTFAADLADERSVSITIFPTTNNTDIIAAYPDGDTSGNSKKIYVDAEL